MDAGDGGKRGLQSEVLLFINPQVSVLLLVQMIQQHLPTTWYAIHDVCVQSGTYPSKDLKEKEKKELHKKTKINKVDCQSTTNW